MNTVLLAVVVVLALVLFISLLIMLSRTRLTDRLLAVQLLGTLGVAMLLVLAVVMQQRAFLDTALVLVMLAVVVTAVFTHRQRGGKS